MLNYLHSRLHQADKGWDPVPRAHAATYSAHAAATFDVGLIPMLESRLGPLRGKRILDLGGGPGHYSIELSRRGANVVWYDVSRRYMDLVKTSAQNAAVTIECSLGYLDDARRTLKGEFDLVFNRVCWSYSMDDRRFARTLYSLVKSGGAGYIECNTPVFANPAGWRKIQYLLNSKFWLKIGHPHPPHCRIEHLLRQFPTRSLDVDYSSAYVDKVFFTKP